MPQGLRRAIFSLFITRIAVSLYPGYTKTPVRTRFAQWRRRAKFAAIAAPIQTNRLDPVIAQRQASVITLSSAIGLSSRH